MASPDMLMSKSPSLNSHGREFKRTVSAHYVQLPATSEDDRKPMDCGCCEKACCCCGSPTITRCRRWWTGWENNKLLTLEDWWSVWLGLIFLGPTLGCSIHEIPMPEFGPWTTNPLDAFLPHGGHHVGNSTKVSARSHPAGIIAIWPLVCIFTAIGLYYMKRPAKLFALYGFHFIFIVTCISKFLGAHAGMHDIGLGASVWSVVLGTIMSNTIYRKKMPDWLKAATCDELFIKINVVMLAVDISAIQHLGMRGLAVAWIDTPTCLVIISLIGIYIFKMDKETAIIMAAATSICGTSAAVAVASIFRVKKEGYQTIVAVMSFFTVPMIPIMPVIGKSLLGFGPEVIGAWIGGTVDTTGAVIASATIASESAAVTAAMVKMLQNSIMGFVCLALSMMVLRQDKTAKPSSCGDYMTMLWDRFPKFVLGFLMTSVLISYGLPGNRFDEERGIKFSFCIGEWVGTMGFVAIGLNIRFQEMWGAMKGPSLVLLYLLGQTIDAALTGVAAYLAFEYWHPERQHDSGDDSVGGFRSALTSWWNPAN